MVLSVYHHMNACHNAHMQEVNVGIVGLGNVGSGTLAILPAMPTRSRSSWGSG